VANLPAIALRCITSSACRFTDWQSGQYSVTDITDPFSSVCFPPARSERASHYILHRHHPKVWRLTALHTTGSPPMCEVRICFWISPLQSLQIVTDVETTGPSMARHGRHHTRQLRPSPRYSTINDPTRTPEIWKPSN
jgi:hypothetical protein